MIPITTRTSSSSNVDFSKLRIDSQKRLFQLLDRFNGTKTIIWDDKLIGPFEFVANATLLKQHDATRLFRLSDIRPIVFNEIKTDYILFFLQKDYQIAKDVAEILQQADRVSLDRTSLVFVPYRCASIEKLLELNNVDLSNLHSIEELTIELFVLDSDVISVENENVFRDLYLKDDPSFAHQIAEGLIKFQNIYGQFQRMTGQGRGAKLVCDLLIKHRKKYQQEQQQQQSNQYINKFNLSSQQNQQQQQQVGQQQIGPQVHQLVLIDRRIDLVTPFLTQLTYEGLLDETFGIKHGTITLPNERFAQNEQDQQVNKKKQNEQQQAAKAKDTKRIELKSTEDLFAKLRDCHINAVADVLKQSAKNLKAERDECNSEGKTIPEMSKLIKRLNHLEIAKKSQLNHVTVAELLNEQTLKTEFIYGLRIEHEILQEDRLNRIVPDIDLKLLRQEPPLHVLRLICLQSIINNGLKPKISDYYKREIIQNYGCNYLAYLLQLEKANLLLSTERYHDVSFNQLKSKLSLIRDDVDECNPNHLSYVYGGYSPISIVVAKILAQYNQVGGPVWRSQSDNLKFLPEPVVVYPTASSSAATTPSATALANQTNLNAQTTTTNTSSQSNSSLANGGGNILNEMNTAPNQGGYSLTSNALAVASLLLSTAGGATSGSNGFRVRRNSASSSLSSSEETRTVLVFFIGGCTFAEISALRFLTQQEENNCEFLIGTTKIINGKTFLKSLWPHKTDIPN